MANWSLMGLTVRARARDMPNRSCPKTETARILLKGLLVFWTSTECTNHLTFWVGRGLNDVEQFHIRDVVDINLSLKYNNQYLSVHLDSQYRVWE